jgi:hypothetical protein
MLRVILCSNFQHFSFFFSEWIVARTVCDVGQSGMGALHFTTLRIFPSLMTSMLIG